MLFLSASLCLALLFNSAKASQTPSAPPASDSGIPGVANVGGVISVPPASQAAQNIAPASNTPLAPISPPPRFILTSKAVPQNQINQACYFLDAVPALLAAEDLGEAAAVVRAAGHSHAWFGGGVLDGQVITLQAQQAFELVAPPASPTTGQPGQPAVYRLPAVQVLHVVLCSPNSSQQPPLQPVLAGPAVFYANYQPQIQQLQPVVQQQQQAQPLIVAPPAQQFVPFNVPLQPQPQQPIPVAPVYQPQQPVILQPPQQPVPQPQQPVIIQQQQQLPPIRPVVSVSPQPGPYYNPAQVQNLTYKPPAGSPYYSGEDHFDGGRDAWVRPGTTAPYGATPYYGPRNLRQWQMDHSTSNDNFYGPYGFQNPVVAAGYAGQIYGGGAVYNPYVAAYGQQQVYGGTPNQPYPTQKRPTDSF